MTFPAVFTCLKIRYFNVIIWILNSNDCKLAASSYPFLLLQYLPYEPCFLFWRCVTLGCWLLLSELVFHYLLLKAPQILASFDRWEDLVTLSQIPSWQQWAGALSDCSLSMGRAPSKLSHFFHLVTCLPNVGILACDPWVNDCISHYFIYFMDASQLDVAMGGHILVHLSIQLGQIASFNWYDQAVL